MFIEGETYSNLTILELIDWSRRRYKVQCKCGRIFERTINTLSQLNGYCKSCRPLPTDRKNKANPESKTHLYRTWYRMKSRCDNENDPAYEKYGAKGISYPEEWKDFKVFKEWSLENGYEEDKHLVRTTHLLDYSEFNSSWEDAPNYGIFSDAPIDIDPSSGFTYY